MALRLSRLSCKLHQHLSILSLNPHPQNPSPFDLLARSKTLQPLIPSSRNPRIGSPPHRRILYGLPYNLSLASISSSSGTTKEEREDERSPSSSEFKSWIDLYLPKPMRLNCTLLLQTIAI